MKRNLLLVAALLALLLSACQPVTLPAIATEAPSVATRLAERVVGTATPTATPAPLTVPYFEGADCPFTLPEGLEEGAGVDCGYLSVAEDRADPDGRTIRLAVAIFRNPDGAAHADPVVYLSGGPGGSALELIHLSFHDEYAPLFASGRDVIVYDQRGVGYSQPALDCPEYQALSKELLDYEIDGRELTVEEELEMEIDALHACYGDLTEVADLGQYNTRASAGDIEDLRVALGYEELNLWGASYGTRLALGTMRYHPEGIRSVILDAAYPADANLYAEGPANLDRAFDAFFGGCASHAGCAEAFPDLEQVFFELVEQLNEEPVYFDVTDPLTGETYRERLDGDNLIAKLFQFLYISDLIPALPQIIYDARDGNYQSIAVVSGALLAQRSASSIGMKYSVQCHEEIIFSSREEALAAAEEYPRLAGLFAMSDIGVLGFDICEGWESGEAGPSAADPVSSDIPTLIFAGEYDPIVPPRWGERVSEQLDNAHFFTFPGLGHGASMANACARDLMLAFLDDPHASPDGSCVADMGGPQFVVPGAAIEVEMEPYVSEQFGFQGVRPAGWEEILPGTFTRGSSALDQVGLIQQAAEGRGKDEVAGLLLPGLGLEELPESIGTFESPALTWDLYAFQSQTSSGTVGIVMALAEDDERGYLALLLAEPAEVEALTAAVFVPALNALEPLEE